MEISDRDQTAYEEGVAALRSMAIPNAAAREKMQACTRSLERNTPIHRITGMRTPGTKARKPLKPALFSLSKLLYELIWPEVEKMIPEMIGAINIQASKQEDAQTILSRLGYRVHVFMELVIQEFQRYAQALKTGQGVVPQLPNIQNYIQTLDRFIRNEEGDLVPPTGKDTQGQITMVVRNAVASTVNPSLIIPQVYRHQFQHNISAGELEEIILNLKEWITLEAMLHINNFTEIRQATALKLFGQRKIILDPSRFVIGRNKGRKLSLAVRREFIKKTKLHSPQLGCPMSQMVGRFHDLVWQVMKPGFTVDNPDHLEQYHREMDALQQMLSK